MIGTIMLKGYPNENGEVIIGYAINEEYRCNGYMTEALNSITKWILLNPDINSVIADTLKTNIPSQKVLKKVGFSFYREDDECFWWKLQT
jgi:RimJ/RimL family protein N-acetyltransferase